MPHFFNSIVTVVGELPFGIEMEHNFLATKEGINQFHRYNPHSFVHKHNDDKVIPTGDRH